MTALYTLYADLTERLDGAAPWLLPTLARLVFILVLFFYFWNSALTKIDGSIFSPSSGAFGQIFPKAAEAVLWDVTQLSFVQRVVIFAGTVGEFVLPALIAIGLLTRIAALGMIGFVVVQSLTDVIGHGGETGAWFDNLSDAAILDQRAFWVFLLLYLVFKGGGPLSLDRVLLKNEMSPYQDDLQPSRG